MRRSKQARSLSHSRRRLHVSFETLEAFREEYRQNLSRGGVFVPSPDAYELREEVQLVLELGFRSATFELPAEVVSVVPAELAHAGGTPGGALQVILSGDELRQRFEPLVGESPEAQPVRERRRASRAPAQVVGKLSSAEGEVAVRSRDLSYTGVLLTLEGGSLPAPGEKVRLVLLHPVSHRPLDIAGTVSRHVESKGRVPALAVAFCDDAAAREEVQRFIDDLRAASHARRLAGTRGRIEDLGLACLAERFAATAPRGTLIVTHGAEEGRIAIEGTSLLRAQVGAVSGEKALARMLAWDEGAFEFHPEVSAADRKEPAMPLQAALLDAARQLDEARRLCPLPLGPTERVTRTRKADDEAELTKTESAVLELASVRCTVRHMLDVIPEEDHVILQALAALLDRGLLTRAG